MECLSLLARPISIRMCRSRRAYRAYRYSATHARRRAECGTADACSASRQVARSAGRRVPAAGPAESTYALSLIKAPVPPDSSAARFRTSAYGSRVAAFSLGLVWPGCRAGVPGVVALLPLVDVQADFRVALENAARVFRRLARSTRSALGRRSCISQNYLIPLPRRRPRASNAYHVFLCIGSG